MADGRDRELRGHGPSTINHGLAGAGAEGDGFAVARRRVRTGGGGPGRCAGAGGAAGAADVVVPVSTRGGEHADGPDGGGAGTVRQDVRVGGVQAFSDQLSAISQASGFRLQASGNAAAGARADFVGAGNFCGDGAVGGTREEAGAVSGRAVGKQDGMGGIRNI